MVPQFFPCAAQVVGVQEAVGFTVNVAVAVPESEAEMVATVEVETVEVVAVKLACVCPSGTTTLDGTVTTALLLERNAAAPPGGDVMLSVTVPVEALPPVTVLGLMTSDDTVSVGGVPHTPGVPPPPQVSPKLQPHEIVPPHPSGMGSHDAPRAGVKQLAGVQPPVTVRGFVSGAWPGAPELALIVTVVVCATEFAAWMVTAPPPVVQLPPTKGWPAVTTEATEGLLLDTLIGMPLAGAMRARTTSMTDIPPGAIVEGLRVKEASGGAGGSVPPGWSVSTEGTETSCHDTPAASLQPIFTDRFTASGRLTTAVDMPKLTDVTPAARLGTAQ
jgi:hypothetical protein